ncbi:hypothetical protein [Kribbella sp. CA-294648]
MPATLATQKFSLVDQHTVHNQSALDATTTLAVPPNPAPEE